MRRKATTTRFDSESDPGSERQHAGATGCRSCGAIMPDEFWVKPGVPIPEPIHCLGSRVAWQPMNLRVPHHGRSLNRRCWKCNESMGCDGCVATKDEQLCKHCVVWTTPEALAKHGPITNNEAQQFRRGGKLAPQLDRYPPEFQAAYRAARRDEDGAGPRWISGMEKSIGREMPEPKPWDRDE